MLHGVVCVPLCRGPPLPVYCHSSFEVLLPQFAPATPGQSFSLPLVCPCCLLLIDISTFCRIVHWTAYFPGRPLDLSRGEPAPQNSDSVFVKWTELLALQGVHLRALDPVQGFNFLWSSCLSLYHGTAYPGLCLGQAQKEVHLS